MVCVDVDKAQFVLDNKEMSKTELAEKTGLSRQTIYRILKRAEQPEDSVTDVTVTDVTETPQRIEPALKKNVTLQTHLITSGRIATRMELASIATEQLASELALYRKAIIRAETEGDKSAMVEAAVHQKAIHSTIELLGKWNGMERTALDVTVTTKLSDDDIRRMSLSDIMNRIESND